MLQYACMAKQKISIDESLVIKGLLETRDFTYQDILNHFEDTYTIAQLKYHIKKHYPSMRGMIKKEYSRGGSKILYLLKQIFPVGKIYPEYLIENLRLDFFIEKPFNIAIEFDGVQHSEYNNFFYNSQVDFQLAQDRDAFKDDACEKLGIKMIRLTSHSQLTKMSLIKLIEEHVNIEQKLIEMKIIKKTTIKEEGKFLPKQKVDWKALYKEKKERSKGMNHRTEQDRKLEDEYKKKRKEKDKEYRKSQYQKKKKRIKQWNNKK